MSFKTLKLTHFRSYQDQTFTFPKNTTVITGPNGSGKTNILEALYLLSTTKSFRALDKELLRHNQTWFRLDTETDKTELQVRYEEKPSAKSKKFFYNQSEKRALDYVGQTPVVLFEPEDLAIINGSPHHRRRFLDVVLSTTNRNYFRALIQYRKILKQRNALLRSRQDVTSQIFAWDIKLVELADVIAGHRQRLVHYLRDNITKEYRAIAGVGASVELAYKSKVDLSRYSSDLLSKLEHNIEQDRIMGHTTIGPHRDDLTIFFNGQPASFNASRGETRTLVLAMKLLELRFIAKEKKKKPTLLLDDVFSELDVSRREYLLDALRQNQTIITTTDLKSVRNKKLRDYHIIELGNHGQTK